MKQLNVLSKEMPDVEFYRQLLNNIGGQWELLAILGQMTGTGTEMGKTRAAFDDLSAKLLDCLARENLKKSVQQMTSKAQVAVDILIRNLFERTADIGFLATDQEIRSFLQNPSKPESQSTLRARFQEYVNKYSVYHNIVLLSCEGEVLLQLNSSQTIEHSSDPLVQDAQTTHREYVEVFRKSDLVPGDQPALIYGYRVMSGDADDDKPLGVLCLCFKFEDELEGIFSNLVTSEDWSVLSILDHDGAVIASSDAYQVPVGARLEQVLDRDYKVVRFAGREYLSKTCPTKGYQGFMGLGWKGHVMVPIHKAFVAADLQENKEIDTDILEAVMRDPQLFSDDLRAIPQKADQIQEELDLTVWNGNIQQTSREAKVLLRSISATGGKTKEVFGESIGNLHETVISSILEDAVFQAELAVDIMDRNLYERANDCRWWALTEGFHKILSKPEITGSDCEQMQQILKYINGLYTVYTNLFVYDANGKIVAVSNPSESRFAGTNLSHSWVQDTLALADSQAYTVSPFEETSLYKDRPTYIYGAVIREPGKPEACGGIGIVFDSEPQFRSMLEDSLPQDDHGNPVDGYLGFFVDRKGTIISSSDDSWSPGQHLDIPHEYLALGCGESHSGIHEFNGQYYAIGCRVSSGYREYKCGDGYSNDVVALSMAPLAELCEIESGTSEEGELSFDFDDAISNSEDSVEIATFTLGDRRFGLQAKSIRGAITTAGLTPIPGSHSLLIGKIAYNDKALPVIGLSALITGESQQGEKQKILIAKSSKGDIGILVDQINEIPIIPRARIDFNATLMDGSDQYTEGVIMPTDCADHRSLLVIIDTERLIGFLTSNDVFSQSAKKLPESTTSKTVAFETQASG